VENVEAVKAICADTDVIIDYFRGREPGKTAFTNWRKKAEVFITSITAFELLLGANLSSKREARITEVESLLDQHNTLNFTRDTARTAAGKGAELRTEGIPIEIRDLFIASICLINELSLLTRNKSHYERIRELTVLTP
jgi:tRNA(fMet)-specific endonuclease VapC